jgi:hypothetical protein
MDAMDTWIVGITCAMFMGVLGWLALTNIQHMKKLAVIEKQLDSLVSRVDQFISNEITALKEIARNR